MPGFFIAQNWRQSPLILLLLSVGLLVPACFLAAIHQPQTRVRFLCFLCKKRSIVAVGLADDVSQKVCVWPRCTRICPSGIESLYANKLVRLGRFLCVLLE